MADPADLSNCVVSRGLVCRTGAARADSDRRAGNRGSRERRSRSGGDLAPLLGHAHAAGGRQPPRVRPAVGAGSGRYVAVVAAHGNGEITEVRLPVVCRVPCENLGGVAWYGLKHLDPRVRAALAGEMAG